FAGAYGAYCVTNFWEHLSPEREKAQARNLADAAHAAGLSHTIWSTFEDTRRWVPLDDDRMPTLRGRYKVPHYDGKGEADSYFAGTPTTWLLTSFYWENFIYLGIGPRLEHGELVLTLPLGEAKLPGIASEDIGRCAYGIFQQELVDRTVGVAGGHLTGADLAAAFSRALGRPPLRRPARGSGRLVMALPVRGGGTSPGTAPAAPARRRPRGRSGSWCRAGSPCRSPAGRATARWPPLPPAPPARPRRAPAPASAAPPARGRRPRRRGRAARPRTR